MTCSVFVKSDLYCYTLECAWLALGRRLQASSSHSDDTDSDEDSDSTDLEREYKPDIEGAVAKVMGDERPDRDLVASEQLVRQAGLHVPLGLVDRPVEPTEPCRGRPGGAGELSPVVGSGQPG